VTVRDRKTVAELGGAMDSDGVFSFTCPVDSGVSSHEVLIIATDEMGNFTRAIAHVVNAGLVDVRSIDIYMDGQRYSNLNLPTGLGRQSQLSLVATAGPPDSASQFTITDNSLVGWRAEAVRGSAHVDAGGRLTVGAGSIGHVVGSFMVAEGASMTAAATFGAEAFSSHSNDLVMAQTIGGTASISGNTTGIGRHEAGAQVEIVAVPSSGYRFVGWTSAGVNGNGVFADPSSTTTVFTMPNGDVTVTAHFEAIAGPTGDSEDGYDDDALPTIWASGDQIVSIILPTGVDENTFVPYYLVEGRRVIVPLSRVENGRLVFRAPVSGAYGFMEYTGSFNDTEEHWARDYIAFAAARGLFSGVGDDMFDPNGSMTRAMLVTVLSRLEGIGASSGEGGAAGAGADGPSDASSALFLDVPPREWYSSAVAWAAQNGIVGGYGDGIFGPGDPITREQMCAIFLRYLTYKGYSLDPIAEKASFGDEGSISSWALDAVSLCQQFGLILGKPDNVFDPAANSTRAEACTVFFRLIDAILNNLG